MCYTAKKQCIETLNHFAIGNSQNNIGRFYLVDFGLCKKLNEHDGVIVKPQCKGCFRGSLTYASLNAHQQIELGRNDDLMSLLYILVEFYNGTLPWSECEDMDKIEKMKKFYCGQHLLKHHPRQFLEIESYILSLDYDIDPNYELLTSLLQQAAL
ncbi:MAG: putative Tau-tubulin kinase 1, partial [Streblomastix strix]